MSIDTLNLDTPDLLDALAGKVEQAKTLLQKIAAEYAPAALATAADDLGVLLRLVGALA